MRAGSTKWWELVEKEPFNKLLNCNAIALGEDLGEMNGRLFQQNRLLG
jgi:hypothetical protein